MCYTQEDESVILLIVGRCKEGNRKAQEQLYRLFYGFCMTISLRYSRDETDAAEIFSQAFYKVLKSIHSYDQRKGMFHAWVKRIIIHVALDHIKSRNRFNELSDGASEGLIDFNQALDKISSIEIMAEIRKLPPTTHAVFVMYVIDGFNHREIAQQLKISQGTSKWHLSEARKLLRLRLSTEKSNE